MTQFPQNVGRSACPPRWQAGITWAGRGGSARNSHREAFSLVEMLVVMAVMSILVVMSYSAVSSFRSTVLSTSGNQLADYATMARQNSIAKNAYTAIVIKTSGTSACSAYCLLQLVRNDDGTFGTWTQLTPWKYLPGATIFETGTSNDTFMAGASLQASFPPIAGVLNFQGAPFAGSTSYQIYQPDGTLMGGQPLRLRLVHGTADSVNVPAVTTVIGANYYDLVFVANSGVVQIERP